MKTRLVIGVVAGIVVAGLLVAYLRRPRLEPPDPAYLADLESWKAERLIDLKSENGWLTVVGLYWLRPGINRFGSDPANEVVLTGATVPPLAGAFELRPDGAVVPRAQAGVAVTLNGKPLEERPLATDRTGKPDVLALGSLYFYAIQRADRLAIRVKDLNSNALTSFQGIDHFPADLRYRVEGTFERYDKPHGVAVPSAHGPAQTMQAPGVIRFRLLGQSVSLEPFAPSADAEELFVVFRDQTAGHETYGAGRFLDCRRAAKGSPRVILDFNRAYNPPCAFTPFATCPLPPPANVLPLRIEAGEKAPAGH